MERLFTFFRQGRSRSFPSHSASPSPVSLEQKKLDAVEDPPDPYPGRDLMFTLIREHLLMQHQVADQHDVKGAGILVGGTTLVGFAFLFQHHLAGNCSIFIPTWLHYWPTAVRLGIPYIPFLLCYVLLVVFALQISRVRGYWTVPNPVKALKSMHIPEKDLKRTLSQAMAHYSKLNEITLDKKAFWIQMASWALLGETIALILFLLYQTIC